MLLHKDFTGASYRLANNWLDHVKLEDFMYRQINYLEIGVFYGANAVSVANTYAFHDKSKLFCIDPWEDYADYPEYKEKQPDIYNAFLKNIESTTEQDKFIVCRGYSNQVVPTFADDFFDLIYVDGNHEPEYVLEDAVLCFRKLRKNGIMIFDDYVWGGPDLTQKGVDAFLKVYSKRIEYLGEKDSQVFVIKL